jgi:RNA polymerase sigma factor (TIGR02999 family)
MDSSPDITQLISAWQAGSKDAEGALFKALYSKLHGIARHCLRCEPQGQTLGATALVNEAYLRFTRSEQIGVTDRSHFLRLAAKVMHNVIVDHARARRAGKRGGGRVRIDAVDVLVTSDEDADQILAVHRALKALARHSARQAELVELRHFAGFTFEECATVLGVTKKTLQRDWEVARTRLRMAIDGTGTAA